MDQHSQFQVHLQRQLQYINSSCEAFDAGALDEAVRIAQALRIIFHQTAESISLLKHLKATTINLLTTQEDIGADQEKRVGLSDFRLYFLHGKAHGEYGPTLSLQKARSIPMSSWWDQVVIALDVKTRITRRRLVLDAANYDGGAHVAEKLPGRYSTLRSPEAITFNVSGTEYHVPAFEAKYVALRQIGFEALNSPDLQALCGPEGTAFSSMPGTVPKVWPADGTVIRAISIKYKNGN